ncbi:MAG: NAD-glutamate dehydrogenase domain-containing protein [Methylococcaceae bacterium]|jgi:glutamate dehydrogenase
MNPTEQFESAAPCFNESWQLSFLKLAERAFSAQCQAGVWANYALALPAEYRLQVAPRHAIKDILQLKNGLSQGRQRVSLLNPTAPSEQYRLHFYSQTAHYLDVYMPVLENLGLRVIDQVQFKLVLDGDTFFIKSFMIEAAASQIAAFYQLKQPLLAIIQAVLDNNVENDELNALLVLAGLSWQSIDVLRAYRNYYLQLGQASTLASVQKALTRNPQVALYLFNYFEARFKPEAACQDSKLREEQVLSLSRMQLLESIQAVKDVNDDRILRTLFNLIDATVRCNFYARLDAEEYFIAFKIDSLGVIDMPLPKPQNEIYVHAKHMEGIHLRGGKVSRGGIRWSDRPDDFRTEILDLMQTQISKNALIIPTGAKGGFIVKEQTSQQDFKAAGIKAYITLIQGLLDLTDNYNLNQIMPAPGVAYDDPDPYLVVAADKGTAQFSDLANGISKQYQFWLGDGFASGGSQGYNHKALGITARGAWECVKRHFRELATDIQSQAFSVVGVGSMDGDVFGNGMLLSPFIRLRAAISGQHIFLDPEPSADDAVFNERKRLFETQGSSWNDYDRQLISDGGGVYLRSSKDIPISPQVRQWLGLRFKSLDGEALIRALLTAPVDLLWLGGIGTYVKASTEKNEEVGDRSNDNVRVDAMQLSARVVGEGANLGFTQLARIEYGLRGGSINTDAVDNSAGVDTSDHEVNLKILLNQLLHQQVIEDYQALFVEVTQSVCAQVLFDNYAQSLCLSLEQLRIKGQAQVYLQLAERLEEQGIFDREVESFPSLKEVMARPGQVITRPELAVMMAACKMQLTKQLQNNPELLQQDFLLDYLHSYFPAQIVARLAAYLPEHPLATEIKATVISNKIINQAGFGFLMLVDNGGLEHVNLYLSYNKVLRVDDIRQEIYALDNQVKADIQYRMLLQIDEMLLGFCRWALAHNMKILADQATLSVFQGYLQAYETYFKQEIDNFSGQIDAYTQHAVPKDLAIKVSFIANLKDFPLLANLADETCKDFMAVVVKFDEIMAYLSLHQVIQQINALITKNFWENKVSASLQIDIKRTAGKLLKQLLADDIPNVADYFRQSGRPEKIKQYRLYYQDITNSSPTNLLAYVALVKQLEMLLE